MRMKVYVHSGYLLKFKLYKHIAKNIYNFSPVRESPQNTVHLCIKPPVISNLEQTETIKAD